MILKKQSFKNKMKIQKFNMKKVVNLNKIHNKLIKIN